ncbi:unnamed protein product, partial [Mesorhabditis belari]|uniref:Rho GDP-dissociation inhibitor 1 n=1 Tax=Mesorhabditis belari TaxID=2138241 RepID=A0AAF3ES75_9BILA
MAHDRDDEVEVDHENPADALYKPPAQKSMMEILACDEGDESLQRYKEKLLGSAIDSVIVDPSDPKTVLLRELSLVVEGRPDVVQDLTDSKRLEETNFKIKEGVQYRLRFKFYVQREMVTGLRYSHRVTKMGVPVINEHLMVGSYGPKHELIVYITPPEEAPSGMLARGKYKVHSKFTDDYKNVFAKWQWTLEIAKDW